MNSISKTLLILFVIHAYAPFHTYAESNDVIPVGWSKTGSSPEDYVVGIDTLTSTQGGKSSFIASGQTIGEGFGSLVQRASAEGYLSQRVKMTIAMKSHEVKERAAAWFRVDTNNGDEEVTLSMDNMRNRPIQGTNDWTEYSLVFDVPYNATNLLYGVLLKGQGKIWFDNIRFEIVDLDTPLTATFFGSQGIHKPRNLSFENEE